MKTFKKFYKTFGIVLICVSVVFVACSKTESIDNSHNGIYERDANNEYSATVELSGRNFIITEYPNLVWAQFYRFGEHSLYQRWENYIAFNIDSTDSFTLIETFPPSIDTYSPVYEESQGKENYRFNRVTKGTFSVTDNEIELSFPDGSIEVFDFSRTENTITIDDIRFTRKR